MASINQLISELAHSVQGADTVPVRRALKLAIIHARNELIRHSYEQHGYADKVLKQRFRVSLIDVPEGDNNGTANLALNKVKRTTQRVPRPTRLTNNLPFHSVRTAGHTNPIEVPFVTEAVSKYYSQLPGMCPNISYDYINGFVYIMIAKGSDLNNLGNIVIESIFEKPELVPAEYFDEDMQDKKEYISDDDEYLLPEDMIDNVKKLALETYNLQVVRQTDEVPNINLVK